MADRLYTTHEAREVLRISRSTLFQLLASGELGSILIGKRARRIPASAVDAYIHRSMARQGAAA